MSKMTTTLVVETRARRSHFGDSSTARLIVHEITRGVIVSQKKKTKNTMQLSMKNSTGVIEIFAIVI